MLPTPKFLEYLHRHKFGPYVGVPCSFLKPFINYVIDHYAGEYITANNEGEAIALASGAYLAGRRPVVMFQNSGLGNTVNPLTSLNYVFKIPLLIIATWRGQPGLKDEPQHELMGQITASLFDMMRIRYDAFPEDESEIEPKMSAAMHHMETLSLPYAFIMRKGTVSNYELKQDKKLSLQRPPGQELLTEKADVDLVLRREALMRVIDSIDPSTLVIATTGKTARELAEYRDRPANLYVVGSMGCASSIAMGLAMHRPERQVLVLDGDGAALMRLEALVSIGHYRPTNLVHIVLDNQTYESTGEQRTLSPTVQFPRLAVACGYRTAASACTLQTLDRLLENATRTEGPHLIHFRIRPGSDPNLSRPVLAPHEVARRFREAVGMPR
jgi:phosphonopyruvate decarboxylase